MNSQPPTPVTRREWGGVLILWAGLVTLFLSPALFTGRYLSPADLLLHYPPWVGTQPADLAPAGNPTQVDSPFQFEPWLHYAAQRLHAGELPLWNPNNMLGAPFLGNMQSALFYPLNWLLFIWPGGALLVLWAWLKLFIAGLGIWALTREVVGVGRVAALVAAVTFAFGAFVIIWLMQGPVNVIIWLPWLWWASGRLLARPSRGRFAALALFAALSLFAGHPETAFEVALATGLFALFTAIRQGWPDPRRMAQALALWAGAYALGGLVAAVQLLPFLEYLAQSMVLVSRSIPGRRPAWIPFHYAWTLFSPDLFGNPARNTVWDARVLYAETNTYSGLIPLLLAPCAALVRRRGARLLALFLLALGLAVVATVYHWPLVYDLVTAVPPFRQAVIRRLVLLLPLVVGLLAALGTEAIRQRAGDRRLAVTLGVTVLAVGLAGVGFPWLAGQAVFGLPADAPAAEAVWTASLARAAGVLLVGGGLLAGVLVLARWRPRAVPLALALLPCAIFADLWQARADYNPAIPPGAYFPPTQVTDFLRRQPAPDRLLGLGNILVPNTNLMYSLSDLRGYDTLEPRLYRDLAAAIDPGIAAIMGGRVTPFTTATSPLLNLLNVRYVIAPPGMDLASAASGPRYVRVLDGGAGDVSVFENTTALPRAWLAHAAAVEPDPAAQVARLSDPAFDPARTALLPAPLPADQPLPAAPPVTATEVVSITRYAPETVEILSTSAEASLLVLADQAFPGWVATVDGQPAAILTADHALRAVYVGPGLHTVRFTYEPLSLRLGAALTLAALLTLIGLGIGARRRAVQFSIKSEI
jgi:hypothetical protein